MKGESVYFSAAELDALTEFINHWDDRLTENDEDFYAYWLERVGRSFGKILDARGSVYGKDNIRDNIRTVGSDSRN